MGSFLRLLSQQASGLESESRSPNPVPRAPLSGHSHSVLSTPHTWGRCSQTPLLHSSTSHFLSSWLLVGSAKGSQVGDTGAREEDDRDLFLHSSPNGIVLVPAGERPNFLVIAPSVSLFGDANSGCAVLCLFVARLPLCYLLSA